MSKQFYKNVSLKPFDVNGVQSWRLLGPDGSPIRAFDVFAKTLLRAKRNTRKGYCRWLAEFFDFVIEASFHWRLVGNGMHSREALQDILEAYDEFLVYGERSGNSIAQVVSKTIRSPRNSRTTSATKHAAVRYFLKLSEQIRKQMLELTNVGGDEFVDEQSLFIGMGEKQTLSTFQRQTLVANSMLAGLISGGPKLISEAFLPTSVPDVSHDLERAFPFDKVQGFLSHLRTYRDKALYALCAACGCRVSESLQILWEDIDIQARKVRLIDPLTRPNCQSYAALSPKQRDNLSWKGRSSSVTLLIEPFATWFFEALADYLRYEYVPHGRHSFVFLFVCAPN